MTPPTIESIIAAIDEIQNQVFHCEGDEMDGAILSSDGLHMIIDPETVQTILASLKAMERVVGVDGLDEAVEYVEQHQAWRRGADINLQEPKKLGECIDLVLDAAKIIAGIQKGA